MPGSFHASARARAILFVILLGVLALPAADAACNESEVNTTACGETTIRQREAATIKIKDTKYEMVIQADTFIGLCNVSIEALTYSPGTLTFLDLSFTYSGASRVLLFDFDQAGLKPIKITLPIESPGTKVKNVSATRRAASFFTFDEYGFVTELDEAVDDENEVEGETNQMDAEIGWLGPPDAVPGQGRQLLQTDTVQEQAMRSQYVFWLDKRDITWYPLCDSRRNVTTATVYAMLPSDVLNGFGFNPVTSCATSITNAGFCNGTGGMLMLQTAPDSICSVPVTTPLPVASDALPVWQIVAIALCCLIAFTCVAYFLLTLRSARRQRERSLARLHQQTPLTDKNIDAQQVGLGLVLQYIGGNVVVEDVVPGYGAAMYVCERVLFIGTPSVTLALGAHTTYVTSSYTYVTSS